MPGEIEHFDLYSLERAQSVAAVLPYLTSSLQRLCALLDVHDGSGKGTDREPQARVAHHTFRMLYYLTVLEGCPLIAIAGGQGAGKTTLAGNLYPDAGAWLAPNRITGERIPVVIVEKPGLPEPVGTVLQRERGTVLLQERTFGRDQLQEWLAVVRGEDVNVVLVRLDVPPSFWGAAGTGFLLLPGLERVDVNPWQLLMKLAMVTSASAVVVTDASRLADAHQTMIDDCLRGSTVGDEAAARVVVALSRCEGRDQDPRSLTALRQQAAERFGLTPQDVIPVGANPSSPAGWLPEFHAAVKKIRPSVRGAHRYQVGLLRDAVRVDAREAIDLAQSVLDNLTLDVERERTLQDILADFDKQAGALRDELATTLARHLGRHLSRADGVLADTLTARGAAAKEVGKRAGDKIGMRPHKREERLRKAVKEAWEPARALTAQQAALDETVAARLRALDYDRLTAPSVFAADARKLLTVQIGDDGFLRAVRALPLMALEARAHLAGLANPDGTVVPGQVDMDTVPRPLRPETQMLLTGMAAFLGADELSDLDVDSLPGAARLVGGMLRTVSHGWAEAARSAAADAAAAGVVPAVMDAATPGVADSITSALTPTVAVGIGAASTVGAAGAAGAGAAGAEGVAVASSGAAAGGTAASGALAVLAPALAAAAAAVLATAVVAAGNRTARDGLNVGRQMLRAQYAAEYEHTVGSVNELLRLTREVLATRVQARLGMDAEAAMRHRLVQAIVDTKQARERMLEVLGEYVE